MDTPETPSTAVSVRHSPAIDRHPARVVRAAAMPEDTPHVSAVIVGGGACGMTAGIRLRDADVDCVVLERDAVPSGSTALSSGFIPVAETRLQKSLGIPDSQALFRREIDAKSHGQAAPHLVVAYTEAARQAVNALEAHGITFEVEGLSVTTGAVGLTVRDPKDAICTARAGASSAFKEELVLPMLKRPAGRRCR